MDSLTKEMKKDDGKENEKEEEKNYYLACLERSLVRQPFLDQLNLNSGFSSRDTHIRTHSSSERLRLIDEGYQVRYCNLIYSCVLNLYDTHVISSVI